MPAAKRLPYGLLIANVRQSNRRSAAVLREIAGSDPDVVLLLETDAWWTEQLEPPLRRRYRHVVSKRFFLERVHAALHAPAGAYRLGPFPLLHLTVLEPAAADRQAHPSPDRKQRRRAQEQIRKGVEEADEQG